MKRIISLLLLLVPATTPLFAEAFKGHSIEDFLWALVVLIVVVPSVIGVGVALLLRQADPEHTSSLFMSIAGSCLTWWVTWGLLMSGEKSSSGQENTFLFLVLLLTVAGAAAGYYASRNPKVE